ncbi:toxin [Streptomyces albus subsp. albus]|nr:toxin [Streptomyces albus subsp. albus]
MHESTPQNPALTWIKSSYSSGEGGQCVEVAMTWHKSSHSDGEGGQCIEVAECPGVVHVRDSKDRQGPVLSFDAKEWAAFVEFASQL